MLARRGWWLALAVLVLAMPWCNIPRDQADDAGMLAHLHGTFVAGDMLYDDEYVALRMSPLFAFVTQTGWVSNHWPVGATWLQAPGYLLGVVAARVLAWLGVGKGDPLGVVALLGVRAWAVLVLGVMALAIARAVVRAGGDLRVGIAVAGAMVVGTPMLHYAIEAPLRPHLWGCAVVLALVLVWRSTAGPGLGRVALLGALAGLATCIRPQLAPLVLIAVHAAWHSPARGRALVVAVASFVPWPLVQLRVMLAMYDTMWPSIDGVTHHLVAFLGSPHHGLFAWTPVFAIGLAAMVRAAWRRESGAWLLLLLVAHQIWVDAGSREITPFTVLGTRTWAGGVGFGARKMLDVVPLFLPAAVSVATGSRWVRRVFGGLAAVAVVPTAWLQMAALVDPVRTTGTVHDLAGLLALGSLPVHGEAWSAALRQRALPLAVPLAVLTIVVVPLAIGLVIAGRRVIGRDPSVRVRGAAMAAIGLAVVANLWTSVLIVRTDAAIEDDPARIERVRGPWAAAHRAVVARIPAEQARVRAILGSHAMP